MRHVRLRNSQHNRELGFVHVILLVLFLLGATTFGVVSTQADLQARSAQQDLKTAYVLTEAKQGLLEFAEGDGLEPAMTEYGRIPKVDAFMLNNPSRADDRFVFSRPGQLPCPDRTSDSNFSSFGSMPMAASGEFDGNLDGTADYSVSDCTEVTQQPLQNNANVGRLPWREYFSYAEAIRSVFTGEGDGLDGNGDRLWYAVSPNLVDYARPINQYRLTRTTANWLEVAIQPFTPVSISASSTLQNIPAGSLTVSNVAALVISPGITSSLQTDRIPEHELFSRTTIAISLRSRDLYDQYLDGTTFLVNSNISNGLAFTKPVGAVPPHIDQVEYVHRDEILEVVANANEVNVDAHLDEIADSLAAFYQRNRYLPDPATFDRANANLVDRRFSTPHTLSSLVLSYELNNSIPPVVSTVATIGLAGAAIKYNNFSAVWDSAGTVSVVTGVNANTEGVVVNLDQSDLPLIIPSRPPDIVTTAIGQTDLLLPSFGGGIHVGGTLETANLGGDLIGFIPPMTPFRAADSFMAPYNPHRPTPRLTPGRTGNVIADYPRFLVDTRSVTNPRRVKTDPIGAMNQLLRYLGENNALMSGPYEMLMSATIFNQPAVSVFTANLYGAAVGGLQPFRPNVRTANFAKVNTLHNLLKHGYNTIIPEGTWLVSTATITVFGNGNDHRAVGGTLLGPTQYAYRALLPSDSFVNPGNSFNLSLFITTSVNITPSSTITTTITVAGKGYQFLGAADTLHFGNVQIPENTPVVAGSQGLLPAQILPDQLSSVAITNLYADPEYLSLFRPHYIPTAAVSSNNQAALVIDPHGAYGTFPAEVTLHPIHDASLGFVAPSGPDNASRGSNYTIRNAFDLLRVYVEPTPLIRYDAATTTSVVVNPHPLHIEGYITVPEGSKFYYPPGSRIPLGQNSFSHGHDEYIFPHPFNVSSTVTGLTSYAKAYLAPGAVIHNSRFVPTTAPAGGYIMPSGAAASTSPGFSPLSTRNQYLVTLVNGGVLYFDRLLHYTDGDLTMLPKTPAQRAFRVETNGVGLVDFVPGPTFDPANIGANVFDRLGEGNLFTTVEFYSNSGYYLYPYFAAYEQQAVRIRPDQVPVLDGTPVTVEHFASDLSVQFGGALDILANTYVDAPISHSDLWLYNTGRNAQEAVTLSLVRNTYDRNTQVGGGVYNLIDSRGLGVLETTGDDQAVTFPPPTNALASITYNQTITLDQNLGISLRANPGRYALINRDNPFRIFFGSVYLTTTLRAGLGLAQFGHTADTSPLVLPTAPDALVPDLQNMPISVQLGTTTVTSAGVTTTTTLATSTVAVDARAAQLGLNWPESSTFSTTIEINDFGQHFFENTNGFDLIELGTSVDEGTHAIMEFNSDAYFNGILAINGGETPNTFISDRIPKGANLEVGWIEDFRHLPGSTLSYFVPGMRVVNGVGFYPAPAAANIRMHRDTASFAGPESMTLYGIGVLGATVTIVLNEPQALLPAGRNIGRFDHEIPVLLSNTITTTVTNTVTGPPLVTNTVTSTLTATRWANPVCSTVYACSHFDRDMLFYNAGTVVMPQDYTSIYVVATTTTELADLDFQFVANAGGGALVAEVSTGVATTVNHVMENFNQGQILRLRMAEQLVPGTTVTVPEIIPWLDLSWQNRDNHFGYGDLPHDSLLFNQNNPLFYAVADDCRVDLLKSPLDCSYESDTGLTVQVPPGEFVRLPEDTIAPAGVIIYGHESFNARSNYLNIGFVDDLATSALPTPQLQAPAVRINRNGHIEVYEPGAAPNVFERTATVITEANRRPGTFAVIYPGNNAFGGDGFGYQYVPDDTEAGTVTLTSPTRANQRSYINTIYPNRSGVNTNDEHLYVRLGGFTKGAEQAASYKVTVAAGGSVTLGLRSSIRYDNNIAAKSIVLGESSSASGVFGDMSGWHEVSGTPNLILSVANLNYAAIQHNRGLNLPKLIPLGAPLHINNNIIATAIAVSTAAQYAEPIAAGTEFYVPPTGSAMQALLRSLNTSITTTTPLGTTTVTLRSAMIADRLRPDAKLYARNVATTDVRLTTVLPLQLTSGGAPFLGVLDPRTLDRIGIPTAFNQELLQQTVSGVTWLGVTSYSPTTFTNVPAPLVTATNSCWYCDVSFQLDISDLASATNTVTLSDGTLIDSFDYPDPITVTATVAGTAAATYDITTFGDLFGEAVITLTLDTSAGFFAHQDQFMDVILAADYAGPTIVSAIPILTLTNFTGGMNFLAPGAPDNGSFTRSQNLNAFVGDTFESGTQTVTNAFTLGIDLRRDSVLAIDQFGDTGISITIGSGANDFTLAMDGGMRMAMFGNATLSQMRFFTRTNTSLVNYSSDVADFTQLYANRDWNFRFLEIDELAFQLPTTVSIPGHGIALPGSMVYPISRQLLKAKPFNAVNPFTLTLNTGAIGNIVGGGGVGEMYAYRYSPSFAYQIPTTTVSNLVAQNFIAWNTADIRQLTIGVASTTDDHVFDVHDIFVNHPTVTVSGLEARPHGAVLKRDLAISTSATSTLTLTDVPARFNFAAADNNLMIYGEYEFLPAQHRITFAAGAELEIRPSGINNRVDSFGDYVLPANTTVAYHSPIPTTLTTPFTATIYPVFEEIGDVSGLRVPTAVYGSGQKVTPGGNVVSLSVASDNLTRFFDITGQELDASFSGKPMRQNLWIQTQGTLTIVEPAGTTLILPENSIINPFHGTYLSAENTPAEESFELVETTGLTPVRTLTELVFAPPALILPAGITVNAGTIGLQFEDVKAVVAYSPAPLRPDPEFDSSLTTPPSAANANLRRDNRINCSETNFGIELDTALVNQYTEGPYDPVAGTGTQVIPDFLSYVSGTVGAELTVVGGTQITIPFVANTSVNLEVYAHSYAHPCVMLDIEENFDADRTFVYTSGMLERSRTIATTYSTPSLLRVNDRMRMIGGQWQP